MFGFRREELIGAKYPDAGSGLELPRAAGDIDGSGVQGRPRSCGRGARTAASFRWKSA